MSGNDVEGGYSGAAIPPPEPMFDVMNSSTGTPNMSQSGISVDDENPGLDRGHSLPNVDELKTEQRAKSAEFISEDGQGKRRGGWVVWVALFLAIVVIGVIVAVAVTVTNDQNTTRTNSASQSTNTGIVDQKPDNNGKETGTDLTSMPVTAVPAKPPTDAPVSSPVGDTNDPEVRTAQIKTYLVNEGIASEADLNTVGTPQQKALNWLAVLDGALTQVPVGDKNTPEGYDFMTRYVLTVLFYESMGDRWVYSLNFLQPFNVCYWFSVLQYPDGSKEFRGVACTENGQVAALFLTRNNMEGELPKELSLLTTLVAVDFNFNLIRGSVPSTYQNFPNMQNFFVMSNRLTGSIPSWIDKLTSIRNINLSHNLITGRIPTIMGNLVNMRGIALDNNLLEGNLDGVFDTSVIPGFRKLEQLYLENNQFTGTLGSHFVALANMTHLDISDNEFAGVIPSHLFTMTNLEVMDLHDNEFTTLPSAFQPNNKLGLLALHKNAFANQRLPSSINQLSKLYHLDVSQNAFTGDIPTEIGLLTDMTYLFFADNEFNAGPVPYWLEGMPTLEELSLKSTQRTGIIPTFLGTLSKMVLLDLDENKLQGTIPENLGDLTDLHILLLNRNNLTSTIPTSFKNLKKLKLLFIEANDNISGDLDDLYCANPLFLMKPVLVADCEMCSAAAAECCTACCEKGVECNPGIHVPDLDPIWQLSYQRVFFTFGREDFFDKDAKGSGGLNPQHPGA